MVRLLNEMDENNKTIDDTYYFIYNLNIFLDFTEFQNAKIIPCLNTVFCPLCCFLLVFFTFFFVLEYENGVNLNVCY